MCAQLFTFVRMGGTRERIVLTRIDGGAASFDGFDAGRAQCYLRRDRERLLAVIEATFGDLKPFNQTVRGLLSASPSTVHAVGRTYKV